MLHNLPTQINLNFLGKTLEPVPVAKDLGMHLDLHLSYDDHISKLSSTSCINKLCQISRVKESFDKKPLILLNEALVINKLLYRGVPKKTKTIEITNNNLVVKA